MPRIIIEISEAAMRTAREMLARRATWEDIGRAIGVKSRVIRRRLDPDWVEADRKRSREFMRKVLDVQEPRDAKPPAADLAARIAEREARAKRGQHVDLTAFLMGDPEPGRFAA